MLLSYARPTDIAWTLRGTGAAWLSSDNGTALVDGSPARASRIQWLSGVQTTASMLALRGAWATPLVPRVVGLVGLTLPVDTLVTLAFKRPADGDYTYQADVAQQRVTQLPDGSRCAWFVLADGLDAVEGIECRIHNDVDGSPSIAAGSAFDAAEVWIGPAADIVHAKEWQRGVSDPTSARRSLGGQVQAVRRRSWRTLSVQFAPDDSVAVADWELIEAALLGSEPCVAIPRWQGVEPSDIQRSAILGTATTSGSIRHLAGPWFDRSYTFEESPAAPV